MRACLVVVVAVLGCGKPESKPEGKSSVSPADDVTKKSDDAFHERMTNLSQLSAHTFLDVKDPIDETPDPGVTIDFDNEAIVIEREDATQHDADPDLPLRVSDRVFDYYRKAKRVNGVATDGTKSIDNDAVNATMRVKYAMYPIKKTVELPKGTAADFTPGTVDGAVIVYEIDSQKKIGGFTFHATSSESVKVKKLDSTKVSSAGAELQRELNRDLAHQMGKAISAAITTKWPNAKTWTGFVQ